jgi:hypothetical protein
MFKIRFMLFQMLRNNAQVLVFGPSSASCCMVEECTSQLQLLIPLLELLRQ